MTSHGQPPSDHSPSAGLFDLALQDATQPELTQSPEQAGQVISGRYILRAVLGEGGAAQVWRAEQTEPVRREVALKIVRPGLLAQPVAARFQREHQVLGRMEHPHIAAVFDAGELPDGRTYFVMELVAGSAITTWCKEHEAPVQQRLEIFVQACMAVQHAHQRGILHRDLKPSNVMVVEVDGRPLVKVIDFGIAKALAGDLAVGQDATLCGMVLGTPRYMSPEQAELSRQDVDIRTDVHALGVLLYELLTETTPIPAAAGAEPPLAQLLEQVRHADPEPPSQRVLRISGSRARALSRELRGELDWITLRALQKDREKRYPTVLNLAEDVLHHLRREAVSAGPPGAAYQMKKWLSRHRVAVGTAAAVILSLAGGLAATWWALGLEKVQRQEAHIQADLAQQISTHLEDLLANARRHASAGLHTQLLRKLADDYAAGMSRFASQPRAEARLAEQLAQLYVALEEPTRAQPWLVRRWELLKQTDGEFSLSTLHALYTVGWSYTAQSEPRKAALALQQSLAGYEKAAASGSKEALEQLPLVRKALARALSRSGRHQEAVEMISDVMSRWQSSQPEETALWLRDQAEILKLGGHMPEAVAVLQRAISILPADSGFIDQRVHMLAMMADLTGRPEDYALALVASEERIHVREAKAEDKHAKLLSALLYHATLASTQPGCPGGEEAARRAVQMAQSAGHESRLADAWIALSESLRVKRRFRESEQALRQGSVEIHGTKAERWRVMEIHRRLGDLLTARSDFAGALAEYETAAAGWFEAPSSARSPEKERLIFTSFIKFWELAADANSSVADSQRLEEWRRRLQEWDARRRSTSALP
ncbi:serine/threonine-protein kinase [Prosthecobacter vanneervenii]|uniref:tRNA A-37 threonylcarbamoyl transferase component Bud32/tetratricopeptide (TPR) repeat protein n=1 Tax=Prosthecobacter vanneervenii TaxID=48466 RepID=A0A7W7YA22_9BACT|nr:serine/threonine-protein kinase [Prosthecobacter vanneervenii]MBB5032369.1 tRNA A-37 threonylcarbamoyl transferase component Bud32/tetratricopeptide (TPR) repeat protein [Prosthecobacter vanneervenii]